MANSKAPSPKILTEELHRAIALRTSLNQDQVGECFRAYAELLEQIVLRDTCPNNQKIIFQTGLGHFEVVKKEGRKAGTSYNKPNLETGELEVVNVVEDEPSYHRLKFVISEKFKEKLKAKTKDRYKK